MRRPLFSGIPIVASSTDGAITLFDLTSLESSLQQHVYLLTLYAVAVAGSDTTLSLDLGGVSIAAGINASSQIGEDPVLERFPLRGDVAATVTIDSAVNTLLFGFLELDGVPVLPRCYVPLQPTGVAPAAPSTYEPITISSSSPTTVHSLTSDYIDLVNMYVTSDNPVSPTFTLTLPDGTTISLDIPQSGAGNQWAKLFDNVPMRAENDTDIALKVQSDGSDEIAAYGYFIRQV